jgi:hypothetical protein
VGGDDEAEAVAAAAEAEHGASIYPGPGRPRQTLTARLTPAGPADLGGPTEYALAAMERAIAFCPG